ncbi:hypothetical protein [Sphingobacterium bambusae]|uniref:Uncharacterized protein n=1 Tax=Sphingobacterium bambusae TaxID=662858 RepID=A0ABW6BAV2_9SPHI|nr:hypothetical protein [Sphingobacterium bambusae]WPL48829.1 hypothetical protein SCB77_23025 [Sphingobacterium bambusae]
MNQNNLFAEDMPSVPLLAVSQEKGVHEDVEQDELALTVQKKKRVFLALISVLILFVTVNVGYFLYSPDALASIMVSIFFMNLAILAGLYFFKRKRSVAAYRAVMSLVKDENPTNSRKE